MIVMSGIISDKRILAILLGGENLRNMLDPDGLIRESQVSALQIDVGKETVFWRMEVFFETKDVLTLKGEMKQDGATVITTANIRCRNEITNIPVKPSNDLSGAFGELSGLPVQMKRNLSSLCLKSDDSECFSINVHDYYFLLRNAAVWNTEGTLEEMPETAFPSALVKFNINSEGSNETARISLRHPLQDGFIEVVFNAGILGLRGKQVLLNKNLGQGRGIICECFISVEDRKVPSFRLAFDLSKDLVAKPDKVQKLPQSRIEEAKELDRVLIRKKKTTKTKKTP